MAITTSTRAIVFAIAILLVAIQTVHADYYRPRLPTLMSPPPYGAEPKPLPTPSPKPILYHPPPTSHYQPPTGSFEDQFLAPHNSVRTSLARYFHIFIRTLISKYMCFDKVLRILTGPAVGSHPIPTKKFRLCVDL